MDENEWKSAASVKIRIGRPKIPSRKGNCFFLKEQLGFLCKNTILVIIWKESQTILKVSNSHS